MFNKTILHKTQIIAIKKKSTILCSHIARFYIQPITIKFNIQAQQTVVGQKTVLRQSFDSELEISRNQNE